MMRGTTIRSDFAHHADSVARRRSRESGVAMLTAILFMIIMAGVSTVILGVVTAQTTPIIHRRRRAPRPSTPRRPGIQAALAIMRTATNTQTHQRVPHYGGDPTKLPCSILDDRNVPTAPSDGNSYTVDHRLLHGGSDRPTPTAPPLSCGTGAYACTGHGPASTPKYALITSQGAATQIPRSASSTGQPVDHRPLHFKVSNVEHPRRTHLQRRLAPRACRPTGITAGTTITFVAAANCGATGANAPCSCGATRPTGRSRSRARTRAALRGLCITGPAVAGGATQNALLQPCGDRPMRLAGTSSGAGPVTTPGRVRLRRSPGRTASAWLSPAFADGTSPIGKNLQVVNGSCDRHDGADRAGRCRRGEATAPTSSSTTRSSVGAPTSQARSSRTTRT